MSDSKTLTIDLSEEYKIKIEDPNKLKGSFFEEIYLKAADAVDDIIEQTDSNKKMDKNDPFLNEKQDYNNIIAFCGERGTGKSSAMISFAQSLLKLNDSKVFYTGKNLISKNFHTIKVIDPSLFEEHENIFEVILAQLFSSFEKELNKKEKESELNAKRELLEQFEKVYENLQTIRKDGQKYDGEALETLNKLACGANLRQNFKELVRLYLNFIVGNEKSDDAYLVIPIDDFDLNVKASAEMAEQIRKYLMIPRVILLMAVKIEQLTDSKEQQVRKDFEILIKAKSLLEDPRKITYHYILKLIPINRRLILPILSITARKTTLKIIKKKNGIEEIVFEEVNIEKGILKAINEKFGLIFIPKREENHLLIPAELRRLKEFILLIFSEDNLTSIDKLNAFEEFIFTNIFAEKIYAPNYEILKELRTIDDYNINKYLIDAIVKRQINSYIENNKREPKELIDAVKFSSQKKGFTKIIDKKNQCVNVTLSDVLYFISAYDEYYNDFEIYNFVIAIKIYYSIRLYRLTIVQQQFDRAQIIFGDSPITELPDDIGLVPRARHTQTLKIDDKFNNQLLCIPKATQPNIERLNFFISSYGDADSKRKTTERPYYSQEIVVNNNIQNRTQYNFNLFSFIGLSIYPNIVYERFGDLKIDSSSLSFRKEIYDWHKDYFLPFPIYSIDLIEIVFYHIFKNLEFRNATTKFEECRLLINEIKKRLEKATIDIPRRQNLIDAYSKSPFYSFFNNENEAQSFNEYFSVSPQDEKANSETISKETGIKYIIDLIRSAGHKNSNTLGNAIKVWCSKTLNEEEFIKLVELVDEVAARNHDAGNLKSEVYKFLNSLNE